MLTDFTIILTPLELGY